MDDINGKLDDLEDHLENKLRGVEERIDRKLGSGRPSPDSREVPGEIHCLLGDLRAVSPEALAGIYNGLETSVVDVQSIASQVFNSTHVQSNRLYRDLAVRTSFVPYLSETQVNAFATHTPMEIGDREIPPPLIVLLGGAVNATRVASLALAADDLAEGGTDDRDLDNDRHLPRVMKRMGERIVEGQGCFSLEDATGILKETGIGFVLEEETTLRKARDHAAGMHLGIIAHELGHICLGHTLGERVNFEISRNQEREADSFASSVVSSCFFGDALVIGGIVWWIILAWVESVCRQEVITTHPHSLERLMSFIRDNEAQARTLGITQETIRSYLPDGED